MVSLSADQGNLPALIDEGWRGVTSSPTIFEKAIAGSTDYDGDLRRLVEKGMTVGEIYETLTLFRQRLAIKLQAEQTCGSN